MIFPQREENYVFLDSASTSYKPKIVIDKITEYNTRLNSNSGRGSYKLSYDSSQILKKTRELVKEVYDANDYDVVFTKSATESINLVVYTYFLNLNEGDEVVLGISNHHSNLLAFRYFEKIKKIKIKYIPINEKGELDVLKAKDLITSKTKLVSISHVVNTTGVENDAKKIFKLAKKVNALTLLDVSQTMAHKIFSFKDFNADFYVFSSHKMFGPQGLGFLVGKQEILNSLPPFLFGGDMVNYVEKDGDSYKESPEKFEAGTQNISSIYGFYYGLQFLKENILKIHKNEMKVFKYLIEKISNLDYISTYNMQDKYPILCFNFKNVHSHDVASILDSENVYIRTGHHCTKLLLDSLGIHNACRVSISAYNTKEDIDKFLQALDKVHNIFQNMLK